MSPTRGEGEERQITVQKTAAIRFKKCCQGWHTNLEYKKRERGMCIVRTSVKLARKKRFYYCGGKSAESKRELFCLGKKGKYEGRKQQQHSANESKDRLVWSYLVQICHLRNARKGDRFCALQKPRPIDAKEHNIQRLSEIPGRALGP